WRKSRLPPSSCVTDSGWFANLLQRTTMTKPITASFFVIQEFAWLQEQEIRLKLRECRDCGFEILIPTVAAEHGYSIFPSRVLPRAERSIFTSRGGCNGQLVTFRPEMDLFEILFDECA